MVAQHDNTFDESPFGDIYHVCSKECPGYAYERESAIRFFLKHGYHCDEVRYSLGRYAPYENLDLEIAVRIAAMDGDDLVGATEAVAS